MNTLPLNFVLKLYFTFEVVEDFALANMSIVLLLIILFIYMSEIII